MKLHELTATPGARHASKRVGRGIGSGHGKTSCRGHKGLKARDTMRPGFEGGQTPLYMRLRKHRGRGKGAMPQRMFKHEYAIINVASLQYLVEKLGETPVITPELLLESRTIGKLAEGVRVLGEGELKSAVTVYAHHFSATAKTKIEAAGGKTITLAFNEFTPPAVEGAE